MSLGAERAGQKPPPTPTPPQLHQGRGYLTIRAPLVSADGAQISSAAANVVISGALTAPDGSVSINTVSYNLSAPPAFEPAKPIAGIPLEAGATIDPAGLWTNALLDPLGISGEAFINGGSLTLTSNQGITLASGSLIDASSGAAILPNRKTLDGSGGNSTIQTDNLGNVAPRPSQLRTLLTVAEAVSQGPLILDGALRSYCVKAG